MEARSAIRVLLSLARNEPILAEQEKIRHRYRHEGESAMNAGASSGLVGLRFDRRATRRARF